MAGVTLGFLKYVLGLDTLTFRKGMTEAERDLVKLQKSFEKRGQQIASFGKSLTVGLTLPLTAFAAKGIAEAKATQAAMAQVNAALKSMGPVAGKTAAELEKTADALELNSLFEADEILRKVTANMLTFGNVSGQTFDRAQQAAVDLATRMGTDLQSATILVGKALNDPVKGMSALSKAGIQFTASQRESIKAMVDSGNAAGAQAMILKELERQFSGSAAAAQNTDPWNKVSDAFAQMAEKVGTALLPLIPPLTDAILSVLNAFTSLSPETQKWLLILGAAAVAIGPLITAVGSLMTVLAASKTLVLFSSGLTGIGVASGTAATGATAAGIAFRALLGPIGLAITAATALYLAWKNWDKIVAFAQKVYQGVKTWLMDKLGAVFDWVKGKIAAVTGFFKDMYTAVVGNSYVPDMVTGIAAEMAKLDAVMVAPAQAATSKTAEAFRDLQERVKGLLANLFPEAAASNQFNQDLKDLKAAADAGVISVDQLREAILRLQQQQDQQPASNGLPAGIDTGPLSTDTDIDPVWGERIGDDIRTNIEETERWKSALSEVGRVLWDDISRSLSDIAYGSAKLSDLWKSLLSTALRVLTAPNGPLGSILSGARANGGPVLSGGAYLVGERGPEIVTPNRGGKIISNENSRRMMGGAGWAGDMHVHGVRDVGGFNRSESQIFRQLNRRMARA
jgi:hypothetical protein